MLKLRESGDALIATYSLWLPAIAIVLGVVFLAYAYLKRSSGKKLYNLGVSGIIFLLAGYYFLTYRITLTEDHAKVYAFIWHDEHIVWASAVQAMLEEHRSSKSWSWSLFVVDRSGLRQELPLKGFDVAGRQRVLEYAQARLPVRIAENR